MFKKLQGSFMLLATAIIWGSGFVAQSAGAEYIRPFTYNGIRTLIGGLALLALLPVFNKLGREKEKYTAEELKKRRRCSVYGGIVCGAVLCIASNLQQFGIERTTAGKAGFITALYIIFVPIIGLLFRRRVSLFTWCAVLVAIFGFYLLCVNEELTVSMGDFFVLCCAVCFSVHIMVIDKFNGKGVDGVLMSCVQFITAGILSLVLMAIFEDPTWSAVWEAKGSILYAGLVSSAVGYTLQILGQNRTAPTVATLLMSLESVFAAVFGWVILGDTLTPKEISGCILVFVAVVFAELPIDKWVEKRKKSKEAIKE